MLIDQIMVLMLTPTPSASARRCGHKPVPEPWGELPPRRLRRADLHRRTSTRRQRSTTANLAAALAATGLASALSTAVLTVTLAAALAAAALSRDDRPDTRAPARLVDGYRCRFAPDGRPPMFLLAPECRVAMAAAVQRLAILGVCCLLVMWGLGE